MPVPDKDVSITVNNQTIQIVVEFTDSPGYKPTATVTLPNARVPTPLTGTTSADGKTTTFEHTVPDTGPFGDYKVDVVCSDKQFGDVVSVQATGKSKVTFKYKKVE
jgi:hypothetical protein